MCSRDSLEHIIDTEKWSSWTLSTAIWPIVQRVTSFFQGVKKSVLQDFCDVCLLVMTELTIFEFWLVSSYTTDTYSIWRRSSEYFFCQNGLTELTSCCCLWVLVKFFFLPLCCPNLWRSFGFLTCDLFGYICRFGPIPGFWPLSASISHKPPVSAFNKYHWTEPALLSKSASGAHPFLVFSLL